MTAAWLEFRNALCFIAARKILSIGFPTHFSVASPTAWQRPAKGFSFPNLWANARTRHLQGWYGAMPLLSILTQDSRSFCGCRFPNQVGKLHNSMAVCGHPTARTVDKKRRLLQRVRISAAVDCEKKRSRAWRTMLRS